MLKTQV